MEEIWAVWRVRRKATSGVFIEPGREPLAGVVEKGEAVPPDEDEDWLLVEVSSLPNNPPRAAGSEVSIRKAKLSMRILAE